MMLYARYTAEQISRSDALHLASGGFCFLVVEILLEMFPGAKVVRLTDKEGNRFVHVYVSVDGQRIDIKGRRSLKEIQEDYPDDPSLEEEVNAATVREFFYKDYSEPQLAAARIVLRTHIEQNITRYTLQPQIAPINA